MFNKFLLIALIPILYFSVSDAAVNCTDKKGGFCQGSFCYYVNYTKYEVDGSQWSDVYYGCKESSMLIIPEGNGTQWSFPINHCQHFQTNSTALGYAYFYGNVCNTRDKCVYTPDGNSLVCAGLRTSPLMGLSVVVIVGILLAKFIV